MVPRSGRVHDWRGANLWGFTATLATFLGNGPNDKILICPEFRYDLSNNKFFSVKLLCFYHPDDGADPARERRHRDRRRARSGLKRFLTPCPRRRSVSGSGARRPIVTRRGNDVQTEIERYCRMDLKTLLTNLFVPGVSIAEKIMRPLLVYGFLVILLRLSGQRILAQMNPFDLVVLLTLSNTVQNAIIGNDNSLLGGIIGGTTLVLSNVLVVHFLYHRKVLAQRIQGEPIPLVRDGQPLPENLHRSLLTEDELLAAVHRQGVPSIRECEQVILETSGTITVIRRQPTPVEASTVAIEARLARIEQLLAEIAGRSPR